MGKLRKTIFSNGLDRRSIFSLYMVLFLGISKKKNYQKIIKYKKSTKSISPDQLIHLQSQDIPRAPHRIRGQKVLDTLRRNLLQQKILEYQENKLLFQKSVFPLNASKIP